MKRIKKFALTCSLAALLILTLSCSMIPQGIQDLFATKTPTPTNTATSTPTPTVTPTPTKTPLPPLMLYSCVFIEQCPEAITVYDVSSSTIYHNGLNTVKVPVNQPVQLLQDWTTINQYYLENSLSNIQWVFSIDGQDYFNPTWLEDGVVIDEDNPSLEYPGKWFGVVMSNWKLGESHLVKMGIIIDETANDGWGVFDTGTTFVTTYNFIPIMPPTATATLTPTRTPPPTKTFTPKPVIPKTPTPTPMPACSADSTIEIENSTGGYVTLNLSGPAKYRFELPTGITILNVCPGSYSYTAWGCGGAKDSGTLNSGEAHEFYCY